MKSKLIFLFGIVLFLIGCGGGQKGGDNPEGGGFPPINIVPPVNAQTPPESETPITVVVVQPERQIVGTDQVCTGPGETKHVYVVPAGKRFILTSSVGRSNSGDPQIIRNGMPLFPIGFHNFNSGYPFESGTSVDLSGGGCVSVSGYLIDTE